MNHLETINRHGSQVMERTRVLSGACWGSSVLVESVLRGRVGMEPCPQERTGGTPSGPRYGGREPGTCDAGAVGHGCHQGEAWRAGHLTDLGQPHSYRHPERLTLSLWRRAHFHGEF